MQTADEFLMLSEAVRLLTGILPDRMLIDFELRGARIIAQRAKHRKAVSLSPVLGVAQAAQAQGRSRSWGYVQLHKARKLSTATASE